MRRERIRKMSGKDREFELWDLANKNKVKVSASKTGLEWVAFCPFHSDHKTPNLHINDIKRVYYCFACGAKGHLYEPGFVDKKTPIEDIYNYEDKTGKLVYQAVRFKVTGSNKALKFKQRRPDGKGGFIWNLKDVERVIYNLFEISNKLDKLLFIVEGEKDCNNLGKIGILATTNSGGAGKWKTEYNQYFKNREVVLLPDNDFVGFKHAQDVGSSLKGIAKSIKWLVLPKLKEGEDISNWLEKGGDLEKLFELVKASPDFSFLPNAKEGDSGNNTKKKEYGEVVKEIIEQINFNVENWDNFSKEIKNLTKKSTILDLVKLPEIEKSLMINLLIGNKIFNRLELEKTLKITRRKGYIRTFPERILAATDLIDSDIPEEDMIIGNGLLPKVGFMVIGAYAKEGKTLLSLQMTLNLISGTPFLGEFDVKDHNKVLYIFGENTESGLKGYLKRQVKGFKEKAGIKIGDRELNNLVYLNGRNFSFGSKKNLDDLRNYLMKEEFNIVILDPIGRFIDFDINRGENILRFLKNLDTLGERAWVLVHHYKKPDYKSDSKTDPIHKLVGSSNLGNYCESFIGLEREDIKKNENIKVLYIKMRREAEPAPVYLHRIPEYLYYETIDFDDLPTVRETKIDDVIDILKNNFRGKATYKEFTDFASDRLGVTTQRIAQLLKDAKKAGIINKDKKGKGAHWFIKELPLVYKKGI